MSHMLPVAAFQVRDPVAFAVLMEAYNAAKGHAMRVTTAGPSAASGASTTADVE